MPCWQPSSISCYKDSLTCMHCADCVQTTASSIGINSIQSAYGPIKVPRAHIMLATYGVTSPTEAGHMTHAHTFNDQ